MNKTVTADEANRDFSKLLRSVREGDSFIVTSDGTPVARITPVVSDEVASRQEAFDRLMTRLRSQPVQNIGRWTRDEANER